MDLSETRRQGKSHGEDLRSSQTMARTGANFEYKRIATVRVVATIHLLRIGMMVDFRSGRKSKFGSIPGEEY